MVTTTQAAMTRRSCHCGALISPYPAPSSRLGPTKMLLFHPPGTASWGVADEMLALPVSQGLSLICHSWRWVRRR